MLEKILHAYLKWTGKGYLVRFLDGLSHLGRPASVAFPLELMEQGLAIVLSGLSNTMAIQSNLDWVWPLWVERQLDPDGEEFIPTAINLIKSNLTARNWTSLGVEDSPREAMIDPVGMLTLQPYGWSVFPFLRLEGRGFQPPRLIPGWQANQKLLDGALPCVITRYDVDPAVEWKSEAVAISIAGEEAVHFTHILCNRSSGHLSLRFGLALRPYNPLTVGHINSIRYQDRMWRVNGQNGLLLLDEPQRVVVSDRHHGDPLLRDVLIAGRKGLKSRSGIACGQAEWDLELSPGETRVIEALGVIGGRGGARAGQGPFAVATRKQAGEGRERQLQRWRDLQSEGLRVKLPEARLEEAFQAVKNHLHVFDDGDHFSPGTFLYHNHWFRDSAFIALAFENMGLAAKAEPKLLRYPRLQTRDGFFRSQRGEWDSNGEAMWTLVNHVRLGADPRFLEGCYASLMKGARWIERMRSRSRGTPSPHYGLLPAGFSAEHFGPNDHYYWDNLWALAGLESARWAARQLGRAKDSERLAAVIDDYRGDLEASMDWAFKKNGGRALPCSPYRSLDSAAIGNLVGISPLEVIDPAAPWVGGTLEFLLENNLRDGMFFQRIVHTGLNPYLTVQLARALMSRGDARWFGLLEALLERATPTWTWPEAIHPRVHGGCMGDGDHGWAAAEFLNLVRDMLVNDRGGIVRLAEAIPARWYKPGMHTEATGAPTRFGTVNFTLRQGPVAGHLSWTVRRAPHQPAAPLYFNLPLASGLAPEFPCPVESGSYRIALTGDTGSLIFPSARRAESAAGPGPSQQRILHA
ncbi:MAG: hypothetical protein JF616_19785 [Fibrobacteres bacterium]|nr:hypothetical protein [Fibrobacterota bacterium]